MATNYPGSLDSLPRPTSTTAMDAAGYEGDVVIDNLSDAVEAIETELGTDPAGGQATVKARLGTVWPAYVHGWSPASGDYYIWSPVTSNATNSALPTTSMMYLFPVYIPTTVTTVGLAVSVTTGAAGTVRLGIYNATFGGGGLEPSSLLVDGGTVDCSTTGTKIATISQSLSGGAWYYTALAAGTGTAPALAGKQLSGSLQGTIIQARTYIWAVDGDQTAGLPSSPSFTTTLTAINPVWLGF